MKSKLFAACIGLFLSFGAVADSSTAKPVVEMKTNMGTITLELYPAKAPKTVENFLQHVKSGHYKGTIFHRVIDGFMIQGGGFDARLNPREKGTPIQNEANNGLRNDTYTIAMARTMDPHSATAQFFINVADNERLNYTSPTLYGWGYAVFGRVVRGQDVVMKIAKLPTGAGGPFPTDVPRETVVIQEAEQIQ
jgi:peptidyl-prolyl cis-trans isomerase A (cyclophilin A)/peptidyl-prolyl cis-trans isomerase B (cyclophilin B)